MIPGQVSIHKLVIADVKEVVRIYAEAIDRSYIAYEEVTKGLATPKAFSEDAVESFKKKMRSKKIQVYVARYAGEITGFIVLELKKAPAGHTECWILDLGVSKKYRRLGIASALMREAYAYGNKHKAKYFFLESGASNAGAHELFKDEGFAPLSTIFVKKATR